jgi:hypothetical protein
LEQLNLKADDCTIASLDIINMYPSIKHKLIRATINYYAKDLTEEEHEVIEAALEMQQFSMKNTIVMFREKYYEYGTIDDAMERALTIGGYDSAWLADLVASYILELAENKFEATRFFGMYRDDGNLVFSGVRSAEELSDWLADFQSRVNEIVGGDYIQFTMDIWKPNEESRTIVPKKVKMIGGKTFPYLDMEMSYDDDQSLCFGVFTKPGFQSKYLNIGSHHPIACKKALVRGASIRQASLTTRTASNENESLSEMYPVLTTALKKAGYLSGASQLPKLGPLLDDRERENGIAD